MGQDRKDVVTILGTVKQSEDRVAKMEQDLAGQKLDNDLIFQQYQGRGSLDPQKKSDFWPKLLGFLLVLFLFWVFAVNK